MIAILDYGLGNLGSIQNMLRVIGAKCRITSDPAEADAADKLILPGVGNFDAGMFHLSERGFKASVRRAANEQKPILGICLGMQLLGFGSEEGNLPGLGIIPFRCARFNFAGMNTGTEALKVPHMGWDEVNLAKKSPLTEGVSGRQRYYFVHTYHAVCENDDDVLMTCEYGVHFAAAVSRGSVYGVQFHPEKSHDFGMALLANFAEVC